MSGYGLFPIDQRIPRVALVTGGARRIGAALVRGLAAQGFAVAIHCYTSIADAEALLSEINGRGCVVTADLSSEEAVAALVDRVAAQLGPIGVLINNASVFERDEWDDVTHESWERHLAPNLRAPFVLTQSFAKQLPAQARGVVLNLLDQRVWNLTPHFVSYTVSKSALWTLTQTMALALAPRIRVNAIGPGPVVPAPGQSDEQFEAYCTTTPLRHGSSPDEVVQATIALLALPSVTGQMIALDGGQHLNWRSSPVG